MSSFYIDSLDKGNQRYIWEFQKRIVRIIGTPRVYTAYYSETEIKQARNIVRVPLLYLTLTNTAVSR